VIKDLETYKCTNKVQTFKLAVISRLVS